MKTVFVRESTDSSLPDASLYDLSEAHFNPCIGCWTCWWKTPGVCIHKDLEDFYRDYVNADKVVFLAKPQQGFISSQMKSLFDRMIPLFLPYTTFRNGGTYHRPRYPRYPESSESEIICRFLKRLGERLGYTVSGSIAKGECAGLAIVPERFNKLLDEFSAFGALFEQTRQFDRQLVEKFAKPVRLSKPLMWLLNALTPLSDVLGWNRILKSYQAYEKRLDTPYL